MTVATLKYGEWGSTRLDLELISDFRGTNMHQTLASAVRPLTAFPRFMPFPISAFTSGPFPLPFPLSFPLSFPVHFRFQWKGLVHALLRGHWENIPAELRAGLDSLLKLPPTEPSKNERVAEITKRFKEANGRLRDLGQKRLQLKPGFKK